MGTIKPAHRRDDPCSCRSFSFGYVYAAPGGPAHRPRPRPAGDRRLPAARRDGAALVGPGAGRGPADRAGADRRHGDAGARRRGGARPRRRGRGPRPRAGAVRRLRRRGDGAAGADPPGGRCETPDGTSLELPMRQGVRSWGNAGDGPDTMLVGTYERAGEVGARLLAALPPTVLLRPDPTGRRCSAALVDVLAAEVVAEGLGPGRAARPAPRRARGRGLPGLVGHDRRRAGVGARRRPARPPGAGPAARGTRPALDGRLPGRARWGCPGPRWPGGSGRRSGSRR